ncbi:hypothetical protein MTR_1g109240 [Medicago truncatula]|uniref:Uncharacterized protein n=1 Tax=Medicago truncatula TaxID=3880 RepID=A0A072VR48_MEDTR|nr:hypothetical protein MTR_1g109240 [Medicago truncatula]
MASQFIEENQVVGFESPRDELVSCLVEGTNKLMLVYVFGIGGLGKTTLSKHNFCKDNNEPTPKGLQEMDGKIFMVNIMYHCIGGKYLFDAHEGLHHLPHLPSWICDMWQNRKLRVEIKRVGKTLVLSKTRLRAFVYVRYQLQPPSSSSHGSDIGDLLPLLLRAPNFTAVT